MFRMFEMVVSVVLIGEGIYHLVRTKGSGTLRFGLPVMLIGMGMDTGSEPFNGSWAQLVSTLGIALLFGGLLMTALAERQRTLAAGKPDPFTYYRAGAWWLLLAVLGGGVASFAPALNDPYKQLVMWIGALMLLVGGSAWFVVRRKHERSSTNLT